MWSEEEYWSKAKLYIRRAQSAETEDGLPPFWMSLAMEFIARAALSKVSPVLNADPGQVENIYFALGIEGIGTPKTVPLHAVFLRCVKVVDGFEDSHRKFCDFLGMQRNEELHTGRLTFENLKLQDWLQSYYEVVDILCQHLGHDLDDLLGPEEAEAAQELLKASAEGLQSFVKQSIAAHKRVFDEGSKEEKQELRHDALIRSIAAKTATALSDLVDCPACSSSGLVTGRTVRSSRPYYNDDRLLEEMTCLAESYSCHACKLSLPSVGHLRWSGIEPYFTAVLETSLHELQELEYYEEYMNE